MVNKKESVMKKVFILFTMVVFSAALMGCNTVKGIGEDLKSLGSGITKASDKVKEGGK